MKDLNKHVIPLVAARWYDLGLELLETRYERELENIEKDNKVDGTKTCCRKMFGKWLETQPGSASWGQLIEAVAIIKLIDVVTDIEQLLQGEPIWSSFHLCVSLSKRH